MKKILIIQNRLLHYRVDFYKELSTLYDVVVLHSGKPMLEEDDNDSLQEIVVECKKLGSFYFQSDVYYYAKKTEYDVVIAMFDIRWINSIKAMLKLDKSKTWIWWGLDKGVSSSNIVSFLALKIKLQLAKRKNAIIFYSKKIRDDFVAYGLNQKKLFVANNTIFIPDRIKAYECNDKKYFINVGSLVKRKRNAELIEVIAALRNKTNQKIGLMLIGAGPEETKLKGLINQLGVEDLIHMPGAITDPDILKDYYRYAIASVSFGQAGLAVLQSMAYGVPFVTSDNAITGGEAHNIISNYNGIICEPNTLSLEKCLSEIASNQAHTLKMSENAYEYYTNKCSIKNMIDGFKSAILYKE